MKCPKCGYISFDYNQACPKCNKDISQEREKLNLPDFHPSVPFLLSSLTGEAEEGAVDIDIAESGPVISAPEDAVDIEEEAGRLMAGEAAPPDQEEDLDISMGDDWSVDLDTATPEEEEGPPEADLELGGPEVEEPQFLEPEQETGEGISFEFEDLEPPRTDASTPESPPESVEGLDAIALDEEDLTDLEEISEPESQEQDEVVLDLDDLKLHETGELEIGGPETTSEHGSEAAPLDLEDISLEEEAAPVEQADDVEDLELDLDELELDLELEEEEEEPEEKP